MVSMNAMIEQLRDFDTPLLANTIGYIDPTPPSEWYLSGAIQSVTPSLGPTVGVAVTCEMDTSTPGEAKHDMAAFWDQLEQINRMDFPVVWVVKAVGSRPDHECILGDGVAKILYSVGCVGVVTNGRVRDVQGLLATPLAAYCRGTVAHHCSVRVQRPDVPLEIGGITVNPDDLIHANAEGVIKIPKACLKDLCEQAPRMRAFEHDAHRLLRRTDISTGDKRERVAAMLSEYGFHPRR